MSKLTNKHNIRTSVAVWLAHDTYDHNTDPYYFSATGLLAPVKQTILAKRPLMIAGQVVETADDIIDMVASRRGTAIHDGIEKAWDMNARQALENLGMGSIANRVIVNPEPEQSLPDSAIPVYMEQRSIREIDGYKIGGKFDFLSEGVLEDFKTTSTYTYIKGTNDDQYIKQASIYRWLNPTLVYEDYFYINYIFNDWLRSKTLQDPSYPQTPIISKRYLLMSIDETEAFIKDRVHNLSRYMNAPESDMPRCTDEELWRSPTTYKYFKNPQKLGRSTKNFDSLAEAQLRYSQDGNVGVIQEHKGQVKRCNYCPAFHNCQQKNEYLNDGSLVPTKEIIV